VPVCNANDPSSLNQLPSHPLGSHAKVLLSSVFGPYARDDEYGSRATNPMELYHNQVTRVQGPFSLRMFHRSSGLMIIQANIAAPCTLLDYPTLDRFTQEIRQKPYDIIGISAIQPNLKKVQIMCALIREHQPKATIVVGGHISMMQDLEKKIDPDHLVRGEGIRWFRKFLGEDMYRPISHPFIPAAVNPRCMGMRMNSGTRDTAAVLVPSVGCPMGCNFCSTSALFGGKGKFINFYETGDELFHVMSQLQRNAGVRSFFVMDENFLLHRKRALRLLDLMRRYEKAWSLYVFSSAEALKSYSMDQLVGLGISWVWIGLEGQKSRYEKLQGIDTHSLVAELQDNGIRVLGSSLIGLEEHSPESIDEVIEWAVTHHTDFHQFMLYTPPQGTPLHAELAEKGLLLSDDEMEPADVHGQWRFNYRHPHIRMGQETEFLLRAFQRDFEVNGPSVIHSMRTLMKGWIKHKNHPEPRVRRRFAAEVESMPILYAGAAWAASRWYRADTVLAPWISGLLQEIYREFGVKARLAAPILGRFVLDRLHREERRLSAKPSFEPPTFYETSVKAVVPPPSS
jgi:radical SAM superfamily enzyme YgiQ (UPF0313 family)